MASQISAWLRQHPLHAVTGMLVLFLVVLALVLASETQRFSPVADATPSTVPRSTVPPTRSTPPSPDAAALSAALSQTGSVTVGPVQFTDVGPSRVRISTIVDLGQVGPADIRVTPNRAVTITLPAPTMTVQYSNTRGGDWTTLNDVNAFPDVVQEQTQLSCTAQRIAQQFARGLALATGYRDVTFAPSNLKC